MPRRCLEKTMFFFLKGNFTPTHGATLVIASLKHSLEKHIISFYERLKASPEELCLLLLKSLVQQLIYEVFNKMKAYLLIIQNEKQ